MMLIVIGLREIGEAKDVRQILNHYLILLLDYNMFILPVYYFN